MQLIAVDEISERIKLVKAKGYERIDDHVCYWLLRDLDVYQEFKPLAEQLIIKGLEEEDKNYAGKIMTI